MANEMNDKDLNAFKHFLAAYKHQWDLNQSYREQYDEDIEYYLGFIEEGRYPLAYNMSFNKLLPRSMTVLSRFMDQMYQPATHDFVAVRARKRRDVERLPRVRGLLNYQLETLNDIDMFGGNHWFHMQWMSNALNWGKGIAKSYWKKEERIAPRRIDIPMPIVRNGQIVDIDVQSVVIQDAQMMYNGPYCEIRHNKTFVPHPHYKNVQQMPFVFDVYKKQVDEIWKKQKEGIYKNVDKLGWSSARGSTTSASTEGHDSAEAFARSIIIDGMVDIPTDFASKRMPPSVDIIECYGKYIFPEDESPITVGQGVQIKGVSSEAIAHIGNYQTLLSLQKNTYGVRPYFIIGCYPHPELFWDLGLIRLGKGIQEQYNVLANTRFQNALQMVNQMMKVQIDSDIDPAALIPKPSGIVPVETMEDVQPLLMPDVSQTGVFREQEQFFEDAIGDITGMGLYNLGTQPPARQEHVGTIYSLQSMGEARTRLLMMMMDYQGFQPLLRYFMTLNVFHLPPKFEARINDKGSDTFQPLFSGDLHWDYDFTVRYTSLEPALGKHFRVQQLLQWANIWAQSPALKQDQIMRASLELMDFHESDRFIRSEQELGQMQQQAQMQQLQMMTANAQLQDQLAASNDERDLIKSVATQLVKG